MIDPSIAPSQWGAQVNYDQWSDPVYPKDKIIVHYNGPRVDPTRDEKAFLKAVERFHVETRGWRGIAYGWAIGQSGTIYRLRGWNNYGAHQGDYDADNIYENKEGIPVFFCIGDGQAPSTAALDAFTRLHKYLSQDSRSVGDNLLVIGHEEVKHDGRACPGTALKGMLPLKWWEDKPCTSVMGAAVATMPQALAWVLEGKNRRGSPYDDATMRQIVIAYYNVGSEYGVRADLALAQSAKETGFWAYGGDVQPEQWNFAGIGATGGVAGITYPTIVRGVRGHMLRMRMYALNDPAMYDEDILKRPLPQKHWGKYPCIENFNGVWAYPGTNYGQSIVADYLEPMIGTTPLPMPTTLEERVASLEQRVAALEGR